MSIRRRLRRIRFKTKLVWRRWRRPVAILLFVGFVVVSISIAIVPLSDIQAGDGAGVDRRNDGSERGVVRGSKPGDPVETKSYEEFNKSLIEDYFIQYLNQERAKRGMDKVSQWKPLTELGQSHSENMVEKDFFNHTNTSGYTPDDRYAARGLLPKCKLPTLEGGFYAGAENIAAVDVGYRYNLKGVVNDSIYVDSEKTIARYLFVAWMNSKGHREAMLVYSAERAGLGIAITESGRLYAALELC